MMKKNLILVSFSFFRPAEKARLALRVDVHFSAQCVDKLEAHFDKILRKKKIIGKQTFLTSLEKAS